MFRKIVFIVFVLVLFSIAWAMFNSGNTKPASVSDQTMAKEIVDRLVSKRTLLQNNEIGILNTNEDINDCSGQLAVYIPSAKLESSKDLTEKSMPKIVKNCVKVKRLDEQFGSGYDTYIKVQLLDSSEIVWTSEINTAKD